MYMGITMRSLRERSLIRLSHEMPSLWGIKAGRYAYARDLYSNSQGALEQVRHGQQLTC